jgi:hypothetical protein
MIQSPFGQLREIPPDAPPGVGAVVPLQADAHDAVLTELVRLEDALALDKRFSAEGRATEVRRLREQLGRTLDAIAQSKLGESRLAPHHMPGAHAEYRRPIAGPLPWVEANFPRVRDRVAAKEIRDGLYARPDGVSRLAWQALERNAPSDHLLLFAIGSAPPTRELLSAEEWARLERVYVDQFRPEVARAFRGWDDTIARVEQNAYQARKWLTDSERRPRWSRLAASAAVPVG